MTRDGDLARILRKHLPTIDWQPIETRGSTGTGIPDLNYCDDGHEGWIELKKVRGNRVLLTPEQATWAHRRRRNGGRALVMARRQRKIDELYVWDGLAAHEVRVGGIMAPPLLLTGGGPAGWDWLEIRRLMRL